VLSSTPKRRPLIMRIERSEIRGDGIDASSPDFAVLNPGYLADDNTSIHIEAKAGNVGPDTA
jgi:hypothetical protein